MSLAKDITIKREHEIFAKYVVPVGANDYQKASMQHAFYGGFTAALNLMTETIAEMSDEEGSQTLEQLLTEANAFYESLRR